VAGNTSQICEYELIAPDSLANDYGNLKIEHWAAINEGVKLSFFATRIDAGRQGGDEVPIKLPSDEFGIELVGVNTGQLCAQAGSNHAACQFMGGLAPQGEYGLQAGAFQLFLMIGAHIFEEEIAESNSLDSVADCFLAGFGHSSFILLVRTWPGQMHWPERQTGGGRLPLDQVKVDLKSRCSHQYVVFQVLRERSHRARQ